VLLAAVISLGLSTQLLFQRELYALWPVAAIGQAWLDQWRDAMVTSATILAAIAAAGRLQLRTRVAKASVLLGATMLGALAGESIAQYLDWGSLGANDSRVILERSWRWLPLALLIAWLFHLRARVAAVTSAARAAAEAKLDLALRSTQSELEILQARIEPHFLYNTLATIRRLQQSDPQRGQETLASFIGYLRAALPHMREREITLGQELALVDCYLQVLKERMEERLGVAIDVPDALRALYLPPLSLATLVENAIKHGLSSLDDGGTVSIAAAIDGARLVIRVSDTGVGLVGSGGSGTGLTNLRGRLQGLYGPAGSIVLAANRPRGAVATLCVPARHVRETATST
jgi:signal transduction histidine kinase